MGEYNRHTILHKDDYVILVSVIVDNNLSESN